MKAFYPQPPALAGPFSKPLPPPLLTSLCLLLWHLLSHTHPFTSLHLPAQMAWPPSSFSASPSISGVTEEVGRGDQGKKGSLNQVVRWQLAHLSSPSYCVLPSCARLRK